MGFAWACVNASGGFANSASACASRARGLPTPIPCCRRRIKKLQALSLDTAVDLWAMDEVHFQQYGSRCRLGVPPETKDPVLLHYPTRRSVGYFGAVRLRDGKFFFRRETDKFNAVTCWEFLQHLQAASTRTQRRVVVITDN